MSQSTTDQSETIQLNKPFKFKKDQKAKTWDLKFCALFFYYCAYEASQLFWMLDVALLLICAVLLIYWRVYSLQECIKHDIRSNAQSLIHEIDLKHDDNDTNCADRRYHNILLIWRHDSMDKMSTVNFLLPVDPVFYIHTGCWWPLLPVQRDEI